MEVKKIKLSVLGFSFNQTQSGTYGLVLAEDEGLRRLMIVVGTPEAQSIAFKLQNTEPPRPLTHDLFYSFMNSFDIKLEEVLIYKYENGVFYSKLLFQQDGKTVEVESRTSDAIGIALRSKSGIYTTEDIMRELAVVFTEGDEETASKEMFTGAETPANNNSSYALLNQEELQSMLNDAINNEDYELASVLRDELKKRVKDH